MNYKPNFDNLRGPMDGFDPADPSPSQRNVLALQAFLFANALDDEMPPQSWSDVIESIENGLDFWKSYYCGLDPADLRPENTGTAK